LPDDSCGGGGGRGERGEGVEGAGWRRTAAWGEEVQIYVGKSTHAGMLAYNYNIGEL
jgi:hypothetical protein